MTNNFKSLRKAASVSQAELAAALGVSQQAVSKWENGTGSPLVEKLPKLAEVLGCSIEVLFQ